MLHEEPVTLMSDACCVCNFAGLVLIVESLDELGAACLCWICYASSHMSHAYKRHPNIRPQHKPAGFLWVHTL